MSSTIEIVALRSTEEFRAELVVDARRGLASRPRTLPPKYFYDGHGSRLFERITKLPEYYLTRAETSILEQRAAEIFEVAPVDELVEIGGGFSYKSALLLRQLLARGGTRYVSLDVSADALGDAGARLSDELDGLEFVGVVGDFQRDLARIPRGGLRLVAFLGSTIGNLAAGERRTFLRAVRAMLEHQDHFLLGVDLVKDTTRLVAAYDDAEGVTAEFNLNVLHVLNRELDGDFQVDAFAHRALYDAEHERIEMRLVARRAVTARLARIDLEVVLEAGEEIHTELSCKFRREFVEEELVGAGLLPIRWFTDEAGDFALVLARTAPLEACGGLG